MTLIVLPGALAAAVGAPLSPAGRWVARALGLRHILQALVLRADPDRVVWSLGVGVDAVHTASMVGLAALSPATRRAAAGDAGVEALIATLTSTARPGN